MNAAVPRARLEPPAPAACRSPGDDELSARIRAAYAEMPGLCLTRAQARRLWNLDADACHRALDRLVASGDLKAAAHGRFMRGSSAV